MRHLFGIIAVIISASTLAFSQHDYTEPAVSPDGKLLAYCSNKLSQNAIFIAHIDGTGEKLLIDLEGYESTPNWSPDGQKICFYLMDKEAHSGLYMIEANGKNLVNLTKGKLDDPESVRWKSDHELLFSAGTFPNKNIYLLDINSGDIAQLTQEQGLNYYPDCQQNQLAFCKLSRTTKGIFLKDLESGQVEQLTEQGEAPILANDASFILYQGKTGDITGIRKIDLKSKENTPVTHNAELSELPDLAPDGKHLFYQRKINGKFSIWRIALDGTDNVRLLGG